MADTTLPVSADTLKIWEGVYRSFDEAAADQEGPGFDGTTWHTRSAVSARECLAALQAGQPIPQFHKQRSVLLPPVAALLLAQRPRLRILDFGGNLGIGYLTLVESIPEAARRIEYTIVEKPKTCEEGRRLLAGDIGYHSALPEHGTFDLVHSSSALQYVQDWQRVLERLAGYPADFILLSDVFAGSIPTFVTLQRYYDSRIPHWFWNLDEFLTPWTQAGYRVDMKTFASSRRLGIDDTLPMGHFPNTHRLEQTLHILLRRMSGNP